MGPNGLKLRVGLVLAALVWAAGCGGGGRQAGVPSAPAASQPGGGQPVASGAPAASSQGQSSGEINACNLLTSEELAPVIGGEIWSRGELLQHGPGNSDCLFQYEENRIFVRYRAGTTSFEYNKMMAENEEAVPGVGDEAYWYPHSKTLEIRVKDNTLEIEMAFPPNRTGGDLKSGAVELGKKAAARM